MTPKFQLPKNKEQLLRATDYLENAARQRRRHMRVSWVHDLAYVRGIRKFRVLWETGEVQISYQDDRGELNLRYEDTLQKRQREIGRLMQIDTRPAVKPLGLGLDALRKASTAQVVLEYLESNQSGEEIKQRMVEDLIDFGTAALGIWVSDKVHIGATTIIENIPAWEILPIPTEPARNYEVKGMCRDRWVPFDWLKAKNGLTFPRNREELDLRKIAPGERVPNDSDPEFWRSQGNASSGSTGSQREKGYARGTDLSIDWVYLREFWIEGDQGRVARYIVKAGNAIVLDVDDFGDDPPVMPISVARYHSTGFYGRSFISPLIPINKQVEKMAANVFQNIIDLDVMGIKVLPTSAGINKKALRDMGRNRYLFADFDYSLPQAKPYQLLPQNLGDMPSKTIAFGNSLIDRLSRESDMYSGKAPGRMDSARGLGLLYETMSIPLVPVTASIANAYAQIYRAMLQKARELLGEDNAIRLITLDDATPGVQINPSDGSMSLDGESGIPDPSEVHIDIKERLPRFPEKRKAELDEALQSQRIDPVDYIIIALKENLDIPLGNRGIIENIRTQWLENLIMFGDGKEPGEVTTNPKYDNHKIQLRILEDFMARPEFRLSSEAVQQKFYRHHEYHEQSLGSWPEQIPSPETFENMPEDLQQMMSQAAGPMGPPQQGMPAPA